MSSKVRKGAASVLVAIGLVLASPAPAHAMTISCFPYAMARLWVTKCVVHHEDGSREWFVVTQP